MEKRKFVSGVVEGFYGRPWTPPQRLDLFERLENLSMNTYLYAPKDDIKHRQMWRELYTDFEAAQLKYLIDASKRNNITFVYAISPGLDITFSNTNDVFLLKQKMNQVLQLGCNAFSLLFDDIDPNLNEIDKKSFDSLSNAQVTVTNDIFNFLKQPSFFLFCPTEYCGTRAMPSVTKSEYLHTIGSNLLPEIDIMWTGPKVISKYITVESILEVSEILKRYPVIWDNIHANDYDQKRIFLGPYCGRSTKLIPHLRGVLTNPNCEFEGNFIAIHTMSQWIKSNKPFNNEIDKESDCSQDINTFESEYLPSKALKNALIDWIKLLYYKKESNYDHLDPSMIKNNLVNCKSVSEGLIAAAGGSLPPQTASASVAASQIFSSEELSTTSNAIAHISNAEDIAAVVSENLIATDTKGDEVKEAFSTILQSNFDQENKNITNAALAVATVVAQVTEEEAAQKAAISDDSVPFFNFKLCDSSDLELLANYDNNNKEKESKMNIEVNNIDCDFTPMDIEVAPSDLDNVTDSMIMQVDTVDDNNVEKMDIFEETNNKPEAPESDGKTNNIATDDVSKSIGNQLTLDDLTLLTHLFFLPYEHGPQAVKMLELIHWLRSHAHLVDRRYITHATRSTQSTIGANDELTSGKSEQSIGAIETSITQNKSTDMVQDSEESESELMERSFKSIEWHSKAKEFMNEVERVRALVDRLCNVPNRTVLYDLYPYIQDMRYVLGTLKSYVMWMDDADISYGNVCALRRLLSWCTPGYKESFMSDDHEPWMFRGGLISEFQRMFPLEGSYDLFPNRASFLQYPPRCLSNNGSIMGGNFDDDPEISYKKSLEAPCFSSQASNITSASSTAAVATSSQIISTNNNIPTDSTDTNHSTLIANPESMLSPGQTLVSSTIRSNNRIIRPSVYVMRQYYPSDKQILYNLSLELLYSQLSRDPQINKEDLMKLYSKPEYRDLPGDRYIGHFLEFEPQTCMILSNDDDVIIGYALGTSKIKEFLQFRRNIYNKRMRLKYKISKEKPTDKSDYIDVDINEYQMGDDNLVTSNKSIVQTLFDGFEETEQILKLEEIDDQPNAFIHIDLIDCCKETDLDTIDTLSRKLLVCLCSAIKTSTVQASDKIYPVIPEERESEPPIVENKDEFNAADPNQEFAPHVQQPNFMIPHLPIKDRFSNFSLAIYCEVDSLNKCFEEFYRRCGFTKACYPNNNDLLNNDAAGAGASNENKAWELAIMSRYV